jgi:signal transduction histidine kinase
VLGASPILVAVATGISAFLYLRTRRPLARAIDHAVFGDRERRASIAAVEAERARLAHEIHDEPLQALGASIRRLETAPDPEGEVARLRELAARLRSVATELRPPVLDDLGLGPALELLADQAAADHATISVSIATDDRTGRSGDSRLPPDVEVALYRIVQEAIANARRHSGGTCVEVSGQIERDYARLSVSDDGVGLSAPRSELGPSSGPPRSGHLGLRSMRARATAIGADLEIGDRQGGGTRVAVEWRRR